MKIWVVMQCKEFVKGGTYSEAVVAFSSEQEAEHYIEKSPDLSLHLDGSPIELNIPNPVTSLPGVF